MSAAKKAGRQRKRNIFKSNLKRKLKDLTTRSLKENQIKEIKKKLKKGDLDLSKYADRLGNIQGDEDSKTFSRKGRKELAKKIQKQDSIEEDRLVDDARAKYKQVSTNRLNPMGKPLGYKRLNKKGANDPQALRDNLQAFLDKAARKTKEESDKSKIKVKKSNKVKSVESESPKMELKGRPTVVKAPNQKKQETAKPEAERQKEATVKQSSSDPIKTKRGTGKTYKSAWDNMSPEKKAKFKGGYGQFEKEAQDWNAKQDAKKDIKTKSDPKKGDKIDPIIKQAASRTKDPANKQRFVGPKVEPTKVEPTKVEPTKVKLKKPTSTTQDDKVKKTSITKPAESKGEKVKESKIIRRKVDHNSKEYLKKYDSSGEHRNRKFADDPSNPKWDALRDPNRVDDDGNLMREDRSDYDFKQRKAKKEAKHGGALAIMITPIKTKKMKAVKKAPGGAAMKKMPTYKNGGKVTKSQRLQQKDKDLKAKATTALKEGKTKKYSRVQKRRIKVQKREQKAFMKENT